MNPLVLENEAPDGQPLQAFFLPDKGMNLISFKKGDVEVIDQSTRPLFEERFAGLGALIGPHFHRRAERSVPKIKDESLFPHIARVRSKGVQDPFSHGIARYAPWKADIKGNKITAVLTGKDLWNGVPIAELEGQNFKMEFKAELRKTGLFLNLSIVSDTDSLVGIHYYYALPNGRGKIVGEVRDRMLNSMRELVEIPPDLTPESPNRLMFDLDRDTDFTFRPWPNPLEATITLETDDYTLKTHYQCMCEENCWQLYHPKGASFVCIEPISSLDPRHPNLTVSSLDIHLEIL